MRAITAFAAGGTPPDWRRRMHPRSALPTALPAALPTVPTALSASEISAAGRSPGQLGQSFSPTCDGPRAPQGPPPNSRPRRRCLSLTTQHHQLLSHTSSFRPPTRSPPATATTSQRLGFPCAAPCCAARLFGAHDSAFCILPCRACIVAVAGARSAHLRGHLALLPTRHHPSLHFCPSFPPPDTSPPYIL